MKLFPGLRVAAVAGLGVDGRKFPHARQRNLSALEQLGRHDAAQAPEEDFKLIEGVYVFAAIGLNRIATS